MDLRSDPYQFHDLGKINVLIGKNGVGKSTILRAFDLSCRANANSGTVKYVTPERGGLLRYQGNIETNLQSGADWGPNERRKNRYENFREMSVTEFRMLELTVLRKIERDEETRRNLAFKFEETVQQINTLLDRVKLVQSDIGFTIQPKGREDTLQPDSLSSGETELISLAIEILSFMHQADRPENRAKDNFLFLDEPDVHLHPDLQGRLMRLLINAAADKRVTVIIATHSTAVLSALSSSDAAKIGFLKLQQTEIFFRPIQEELKKVLPIFGAHPLSNVFNESPILLVEGEDDERVWQQAVRSSQSRLKLWPCEAGSIDALNAHENTVDEIVSSIYENANAFSLRDRDDAPYEIENKPHVVRARLNCRACENLLLADDALALMNCTWPRLIELMDGWLTKFDETHPQFADMNAFKAAEYPRLTADVKSLCNIILMLAGARKPWEIVVGQAIAAMLRRDANPSVGANSLTNYLGPKIVDALDLRPRN